VGWSLHERTSSPEETRTLAASLARVARRADIVVLQGALGAGKTTFAQGFARGLGVLGPVTSPTFTLVRHYPCHLGELLHVDVYRLDHLAEVTDLALSELVDNGVALVEWGDAARPALGEVTWTVSISRAPESPDDERDVRISGDDESRRDEIAGALARARICGGQGGPA
jgi:tRNA threonylcarbamoyladenosine biosynthesis protein TsaE